MRKLPGTDLLVSELCLGTMTFGEQNTKEQSFRQLDIATKEYGINFLVSKYFFVIYHRYVSLNLSIIIIFIIIIKL